METLPAHPFAQVDPLAAVVAGPGGPRLGGGLRVGFRYALAAVLLDGFLLAWLFPTGS